MDSPYVHDEGAGYRVAPVLPPAMPHAFLEMPDPRKQYVWLRSMPPAITGSPQQGVVVTNALGALMWALRWCNAEHHSGAAPAASKGRGAIPAFLAARLVAFHYDVWGLGCRIAADIGPHGTRSVSKLVCGDARPSP